MYYISDYTESIPILLSEWNHNFWTDDKSNTMVRKEGFTYDTYLSQDYSRAINEKE